ncbi:MAG: polysulfide reductase NrfD [Actinomycetota bacterium]|nr:polysulfide reductase NrfD [Actinomycetota bacterium]
MTTPVEGGRGRRRLRGGPGSVVPSAEIRTYYDRPILKQPVWTWEIPAYFFTGGLAGASASLGSIARRSDHPLLARVARRIALGGVAVSPALLISDLGRPERFHHMWRVLRPTSPMSVGTWVLTVFGPAAGASAVLADLGWWPRLQRVAETVAGGLGPVMATYTAVLVADTAVPVWHEARHELPFVFAGSAAASAGAAATLLVPAAESGPARRLAVTGGLLELGAAEVMRARLGELGEPYRLADAHRWSRAATVCTAAGTALLGLVGRRRRVAVAGSALLLAGSVCQRWAVYRAGFISAADPKYTVAPQRRRIEERG